MILVNGVISDSVPANDRGLAYGDGVFRTLLVREGKPRHWLQHYAKLSADCIALGIDCPHESLLDKEIAQATLRNPDCALKIIVTRGTGMRGYAPPSKSPPTRIVMTSSLPQYPPEFSQSGIKARICNTRLSIQPALAGIKHLCRLENVLARAEWSDPAIAEGVMLDTEKNTVGGTMSNLFIVERSVLITPELARCGVAGVTRARLIRAAAVHGVVCMTEKISSERLMKCDEILLVNSIIGVWQVRQLGGKEWMPGMVAPQVREWLDDDDA
jgi:4-amino-4-deoxychorismate lyase